jgi:hypothetical protein
MIPQMPSIGVQSVDEFTATIRKLLANALEVKPYGGVEPALVPQDVGLDVLEEIDLQIKALRRPWHAPDIHPHYAPIETACRNIFYDNLVLKHIEEPGFGEVWNLFDVLSFMTDTGQLHQARWSATN